jgi:hypothetical protein
MVQHVSFVKQDIYFLWVYVLINAQLIIILYKIHVIDAHKIANLVHQQLILVLIVQIIHI